MEYKELKNRATLMYDLIENMDSMVRIMDDKHKVVYMNKCMREEFDESMGQPCFKMFDRDCMCENCITKKAEETNTNESKIERCCGKVYKIIASPIRKTEQENYYIEIFNDITKETQLEEKNNEQYIKLKKDISLAKDLQKKVLPKDGTYYNAININSCYIPSETLSGDIFDVIKIDEDHIFFYIADVAGHGVKSSLLTIFMRQVIKNMENSSVDIREIVNKIIEEYKDLKLEPEQYVTILGVLYNKEEGKIDIINGGHNCLPILIEENLNIEEIFVSGLPICNLLSRSNHKMKTIYLKKGSRLLLYTDGVTEARKSIENGKNIEFETKGIMNVIKAANKEDLTEGKLPEMILEEMSKNDYVFGGDDIAIMEVEFK